MNALAQLKALFDPQILVENQVEVTRRPDGKPLTIVAGDRTYHVHSKALNSCIEIRENGSTQTVPYGKGVLDSIRRFISKADELTRPAE